MTLMGHPYRDRSVTTRETAEPGPRAPDREQSLAVGYDESSDVGDHERERAGTWWFGAGLLAVGVLLIMLPLFAIRREAGGTLVVAPSTDVVERLNGVVIARDDDFAAQVGERCTVDIADVTEDGRSCRLHVLCEGREQGFIAAHCPLDPDLSGEDRHILTIDAFDSDERPLGHATLRLDAN